MNYNPKDLQMYRWRLNCIYFKHVDMQRSIKLYEMILSSFSCGLAEQLRITKTIEHIKVF